MFVLVEAVVFFAIVFVLNLLVNTYFQKVKRPIHNLLYISLAQTFVAGAIAYLAGEFI